MTAADVFTRAANRARRGGNTELAERIQRAVEFGAHSITLTASDLVTLLSVPADRVALEKIVGSAHDGMFPGMDHRPVTGLVVDMLVASGVVTLDGQQ